MSGLDSTVTGALIAGGFAIIGFGALAVTTAATLRANRTAARDQRLWDKRAPLYEELAGAAKSVEDSVIGAGKALDDPATVDPRAVAVINDRVPQVLVYASSDVLRAHFILKELLARTRYRVPPSNFELAEAARVLGHLIRRELQPVRVSLYQRIRHERKSRRLASQLRRGDAPARGS